MRNRKLTIGIVISLVFAVVSLGIAFAAFSTTLNITGSASVESSNWNVFLTTASNGSAPGSNGVSLPTSSIREYRTGHNVSTLLTTNTFTWSATLKSPNDEIKYTFYVRNTGDYDASLSVSGGTFINIPFCSGLYYGTFTCTQNGVVTQEASTMCSHLSYVIDTDCSEFVTVQHNSYTPINVIILVDDFGWAQDGSDLPKNPVTVTAAPIVLTATQSSSAY